MRLRNIRGSREKMVESEFTINEPEKLKGKWSEFFGNDNPIHVEIGMGKGKFLITLAINNPNINYVGIEKYSSVLLRAIEKREAMTEECNNIIFIRMEAEYIDEVFAEGEVDKIYLNFSDPWPKDRHAKRRLTSRQFFERYDKILNKEGVVEFKTDNVDLFDFSLEEIPNTVFHIEKSTRDLHNNVEMNAGNVMTEYEEKFSSMGNPICKLIAKR